MKIRFLRDCKYEQNDPKQSREYKAGEVHDVAADHAHRWIRRNAAVEVKAEKLPKAEPTPEPKQEAKPDPKPEPKQSVSDAKKPAAKSEK